MKVLKFGAVWCSGCLVMKPRWEDVEKEHPWLETEYHDVDEEPELVKAYAVKDYPSFIFLNKDGDEIHRETGEIEKNQIEELINTYRTE